ncbi:MAG: A24 family peptidase [Nanoarchaeota archaeon]|nr:A24 family peptidase [Nanoarchaeota archaeon]
MLALILSVLALSALAVASYTDLRTREVPDWLSYGLILGAVGIRSIFSVAFGWQILLSGILGFAAMFLLAFLFYRLHQWGGGDSKLLIGLGTVIGIPLPFSMQSFSLLLFFLALLFAGALYGLCWLSVLAIKKRKIFLPAFRQQLHAYKNWHLFSWAAVLPLLFVGVYLSLAWTLALFVLIFFYLMTFVATIEQRCCLKQIPVEKLTPGDWLAETITVKRGEVLSTKTLEREDIWALRHLAAKGKQTSVCIREGIPFVPAFLLAYLSFLFRDMLFPLLFRFIF